MYDLPITKNQMVFTNWDVIWSEEKEQGMEIEYFYTLNALPFIYKR